MGVQAREISRDDATLADTWAYKWEKPNRMATWEWKQMYKDYHSSTGIKRFDIAIKAKGELLLLCYGVPNKSKLILKLHAIERSPCKNELRNKSVDIALYAADAYASLIGSKEIHLCNPVSPSHVRLYQSAGFEPKFDAKGNVPYLSMRLEE